MFSSPFQRTFVLAAALAASMPAFTAPASAQEAELDPAMATPATGAQPADEEQEPETSFSIGLNQDIFFGFYGTAQGAVELSPGLSFTAYTIIWTTPSFSSTGSGGGGLWSEFGVGVAFSLLNDRLTVNPQLGILNGVLLSGSDRGLVFEGIVPNLTVNYGDDLLQAQLYAGYYLGLRDENPVGARDFLHYWANAGVKATSFLAFGLHWEQLFQSRGTAPDTDGNLYMWLGAYAEVAAGPFALRFTAGVDLIDPSQEVLEFYKINVIANF